MRSKQKDLVPSKINDIELGWLAGLWEGEGTFGYNGSTQRASLEMCDRDIVEKQKALIERTFNIKSIKLIVKNPKKLTHHDTYRIDLAGPSARALMRLVVPLMGSRRREQIWRALNEVPEKKIGVTILDLVKAPIKGLHESY